MHGQKRRAEVRDLRGGALHRVGDVMQLEIEEDLLARAAQLAHQIEPAAVNELHADLVEADRIAEPLHHGARLSRVGEVEGDDEAVADGDR